MNNAFNGTTVYVYENRCSFLPVAIFPKSFLNYLKNCLMTRPHICAIDSPGDSSAHNCRCQGVFDFYGVISIASIFCSCLSATETG